jgi:hypothetical protein
MPATCSGRVGGGDLGRNDEPLDADQQDELAVLAEERPLEQVHRRAADERGDEEVRRPLEDGLRHVDLLDLALAHDDDAVAHRHRLDLVVGDVDRRRLDLALDPGDLRAHLDAELRVEVGERLVHQQHPRAAHDRPPHRDALALAP